MKKLLSLLFSLFFLIGSVSLVDYDDVHAATKTIKKGDIVTLGSYEQDNNLKNGSESIEWIVLSVENGKALLLSKYGLEFMAYSTNPGVTWKDSTIRSWLNNDFYGNAFTEDEKKSIVETKLENKGNPDWDSEGGKDTKDKVFLLSYEDVYNNEYFKDETSRKCPVSAYAKDYLKKHDSEIMGLYSFFENNSNENLTAEGLPSFSWLLRTPGAYNYMTTVVLYDGRIFAHGSDVICGQSEKMNAIRPALWITVDSSSKSTEKLQVSKPVIKAKASKKSIKITISKTKNAEGYEIYIKAPGEKKYKLVRTLEKDGTAKRSITISKLSAGEYSVKVMAYNGDIKGKFSKVKKATI